jgi:phospholipase/carboxylesterase
MKTSIDRRYTESVWRVCLVIAAGCWLACDRDTHRTEIDLSREHDNAITIAGVSFTTVFEREADEQSPLLVMLHGRGDTARNFRGSWPSVPVKLQLSFPLAPLPFGNGRQWFEWPPDTGEDALADAVSAAEAKLWPAIVGLAHGRKVMVGGFSQGALVAYAMAVRHPDEVVCAFPIGGRIPRKLLPARGVRTAPIVALHGVGDSTIPIDEARDGIAALLAAGAEARLEEYPGVGHAITPAMFDQLVQRVRARLIAR